MTGEATLASQKMRAFLTSSAHVIRIDSCPNLRMLMIFLQPPPAGIDSDLSGSGEDTDLTHSSTEDFAQANPEGDQVFAADEQRTDGSTET